MPTQNYGDWEAGYKQQQGGGVIGMDYSSPEMKRYLQSQYNQYTQRTQATDLSQAFLKGQEGTYADTQKQYLDAVQPALKNQYDLAAKQQGLADIRRGVHKGSAGTQHQANLLGAYQGQLQQQYAQAMQMTDQQRQRDQLQAYQMQAGMMQNPYAQAGAQGIQQQLGAQGQQAGAFWDNASQGAQQQQGVQNMWSQLYGNQLGMAGGGLSMLGGMSGR